MAETSTKAKQESDPRKTEFCLTKAPSAPLRQCAVLARGRAAGELRPTAIAAGWALAVWRARASITATLSNSSARDLSFRCGGGAGFRRRLLWKGRALDRRVLRKR